MLNTDYGLDNMRDSKTIGGEFILNNVMVQNHFTLMGLYTLIAVAFGGGANLYSIGFCSMLPGDVVDDNTVLNTEPTAGTNGYNRLLLFDPFNFTIPSWPRFGIIDSEVYAETIEGVFTAVGAWDKPVNRMFLYNGNFAIVAAISESFSDVPTIMTDVSFRAKYRLWFR